MNKERQEIWTIYQREFASADLDKQPEIKWRMTQWEKLMERGLNPREAYKTSRLLDYVLHLRQEYDTPIETTSFPTRQRTGDTATERTSGHGRSPALPKVGIIPFASGHSRAQWVSFFLAAVVILDIVAVWSDYMQVQLIDRMIRGDFVTGAEAIASDSRQITIGNIYLVLFVLTAILFCIWIHRAHRNLPSLGSSNLKYSPGWAVGWFFVPIFSLWKPYQVTTEIWKASDPTTDINDSTAWQKSPTSFIVSSWWFLFLVSGFVGGIVMRAYLQTETISEILTASWWTLIMDAINIPAAILAILVVRNIDLRQEEKNRLITIYSSV